MKNIFAVTALLLATTGFSQQFLHPSTDHPMTFSEMLLQYNNGKAASSPATVRNNEAFEEWITDMSLHTDGSGNAGDPSAYLNARINAANARQSSSSNVMYNSWYPVGPNALPNNETGYMENGMGRINCIAFHPTDPNTYFVGVSQGGLWKTTNNGSTWMPLTDNSLPILRISDIAIVASHPDTMYISVCDFEYIGFGLYLNGRKRNTHYGLGVYKTTDGGVTWNPTGLTFQMTNGDASLIRKIIIDPNNDNNLLACGFNGMYRSTDAGATWTSVNNGLFWDMLEDPTAPNTIFASTGWVLTENDGSAGIYKSTDFGQTWNLLNTGIPTTGTVQRVKIAMAPSDHNYIYAMTVDDNNGLYKIYKTTDGGTSWTSITPSVNILEAGDGTNPGGQGTYDLGLCIKSTDRNTLFVGGVNLWGSSDGGNTWDPASHWTLFYGPTLHGDIHFIAQQPLTGNYFVCSDGGVYRTTNIITQTWNSANSGNPWPTQWTKISDGLQITAFYRISSSRNSTGRLMGGAQDNGSFYYKSGQWNTIFGGDGMDNYLDPNDDQMVMGSSQYGNFNLSYDDGVTDVGTNPNVNWENGEWTTPLVADYNNPGTLYAGFENVMESNDNGGSWYPISNLPFTNYSSEICALAVANSNSNVIYAAKRVHYEYNQPATLFKTTDGGTSWTNVTSNLPDSLYYTSVEISENDPNTVYVTMAGFCAADKVFRTTDGGATWQNITYNLQNVPVNCIKYIPGSGGYVMIATDLGVYILQPSSSTWVSQSSGLPNVITTDIEFNVALNKIYVSTFGRGIWATDLGVFTGINTTHTTFAPDLFPSPNNGTFTIKVPGNFSNETLQLDVIDITGKIVHTQKLSGNCSYTISLDLASGMYFAKVSGMNIYGVKNFVVQ